MVTCMQGVDSYWLIDQIACQVLLFVSSPPRDTETAALFRRSKIYSVFTQILRSITNTAVLDLGARYHPPSWQSVLPAPVNLQFFYLHHPCLRIPRAPPR